MNTSTGSSYISATQRYFYDIQKHDLLDRQEESELIRRYQQENDRAALRRLIEGNLRLVVKIAKDLWKGGDESLLELVQEGNIGLMRAAVKFDPTKKVKFSYYAVFWIRAHILKYLMDNHRIVRVGTTQPQRKLFFNLRKIRAKLSEDGIQPTPGNIARQLNIRRKDVVEMQQRLDYPDVSLNAPASGRDHEEWLDTYRTSGTSVPDRYETMELKALVRNSTREFTKQLSHREKTILEHRILSVEPVTLQTLGNQFGVSRERIRQIEKRIIARFREYLFMKLPDIKQFTYAS